MKFSPRHVLLGAVAPLANAFPAAMLEEAAQNPEMMARGNEMMEKVQARQRESRTGLFHGIIPDTVGSREG